jgi:hypothetical protein
MSKKKISTHWKKETALSAPVVQMGGWKNNLKLSDLLWQKDYMK